MYYLSWTCLLFTAFTGCFSVIFRTLLLVTIVITVQFVVCKAFHQCIAGVIIIISTLKNFGSDVFSNNKLRRLSRFWNANNTPLISPPECKILKTAFDRLKARAFFGLFWYLVIPKGKSSNNGLLIQYMRKLNWKPWIRGGRTKANFYFRFHLYENLALSNFVLLCVPVTLERILFVLPKVLSTFSFS